MIKAFKDNPILTHNIRYTGWPSLLVVVLIAVVLTVGGLALTIKGYRAAPETASGASELIWLIEVPMPCLGPILMMVVVIRGTVRAINSEKYRLIHLSPLPERAIVNSFMLSAVLRLRVLWMLAAGLALPAVIAVTHFRVFKEIHLGPSVHCQAQQRLLVDIDLNCAPPPAASEIVMEQAEAALITVGIGAILFLLGVWLTLTYGVWNAFSQRQYRRASVQTINQMILIGFVNFALLAALMRLSEHLPPLPVVLVTVGIVGLNIGLGWWAYSQAVRCVRSTTE